MYRVRVTRPLPRALLPLPCVGSQGALPHSPSSDHGPGWWLSLESEARASLAGGDREWSVHLAVSAWKLPTGVVPPDDSPPRDLSSSLWARSMSWRGSRAVWDPGPACHGPGGDGPWDEGPGSAPSP